MAPPSTVRLLTVASLFLSLALLGPVPASSFHAEKRYCHDRYSPLSASSKSDSNADASYCTDFFFIRDADFADLGSAARILTDGFYGNTNFITYNIERLNTFLSLESTFPSQSSDTVVHSMVVACRQSDGKVLGFAELDGRPTEDPEAAPRPYMCNLAVDKKWKRQGIAKALVKQCEEKAIEWGKGEMYLKVRERNQAATSMYQSIGYEVQSINVESMRGQPPDTIVLMMKQLFCTADSIAEEKDCESTTENISIHQ